MANIYMNMNKYRHEYIGIEVKTEYILCRKQYRVEAATMSGVSFYM